MNYEKLYLDICALARKTTPSERLRRRNPKDPRFSGTIYVERHHILPKSLGGTDDEYNLIDVLPEEHFLLHKIRYKAYGCREDFLACRIMLNGYTHRVSTGTKLNMKSLPRSYAWFRQEIYNFRKSSSWHTEDGVRRISESMKGKIVVRTPEGDIIKTSIDDPLVVSGLYVHHSSGRHSYMNPATGEKIFCEVVMKPEGFVAVAAEQRGVKNANYSGVTDSEIIEFSIKLTSALVSLGYNELPSNRLISRFWDLTDKHKRKFPVLCGGLRSGFRFNGDIENLYNKIKEVHPLPRKKTTKLGGMINEKELIDAYNRIS